VRARVYVARDAGFNLSGDSIRTSFGGGMTAGSIEYTGSEIAVVGGQRWTLLEGEYIIPPGATSAALQVIIEYAGGTILDPANVYIDDTQFFVVSRTPLDVSTTGLTVGQGTEVTKIMSATASLNFGSINDKASAELTITVTGAASGDSVKATPVSGIEAGLFWNAWVSAADTVTVRLFYLNALGGSIDPAARNWRATVFKF
jgi:hypothetical protein